MMNEKHREISAWLDSIFAGSSTPSYEVCPRTLALLDELKQRNETQEKHAALVIADKQQKADEYAAEGRRMQDVLRQLQLTPDSLSQSGLTSLRTLVSVASILKVRDVSDSTLLLALADLQCDRLAVSEQRQAEARSSAALLSKTKTALQNKTELQNALANLEKQNEMEGPELAKKLANSDFLQNKHKQYRKQVQGKELQLQKAGFREGVKHEHLLNRADQLKTLREKLHKSKAKLDSYHSLPPNIALAKVKVEEAKQQLKQLEDQLAQHIDLMYC